MNSHKNNQQSSIASGMSLYLDLIRFLAAMMVMVGHTWHLFRSGDPIKFPGHEAVVVFFVLSGYVIAHASSRPGVTLAVYAQHRMARILPVAWLALILAGTLAVMAPELNEESGVVVPTLVNLVFLGQSGWGWMEAPLNSPYWSLNYEVWYYIIFGIWVFVRKHRGLWMCVALLIAGPKIFMLLPIWLMGVVLYRRMPVLTHTVALFIFVLTLCLAMTMYWMDISELWRAWIYRALPPFWRAHYSSQLAYDVILGIVVTANFAAISSLNVSLKKLRFIERPIRYLASFTLSLYVFHAPLTELLVKVIRLENPVLFYVVLAASVFLLAELTERRTKWYRGQIVRLWTGKGVVPVSAN